MGHMELKCEKCGKREAEHSHLKPEYKDKVGKTRHGEIAKKHPEWFQPMCTLCHAEEHGISPKKSELKKLVIMRDRAIRMRNALENHIRGFGRIEYIVPGEWTSQRKTWDGIIRGFEKGIKKLIEGNGYPIWPWLEGIRGISYNTAAKLISYIDIKNTPSISALWRYCGLDATHVKRARKISQEEAKMFGNPYLKKELMGILADSFIKQRTPVYRKIYDDAKAREASRKDDNRPKSKMHAHLRAKRKAVKIFLAHLWAEWRRLEGLPVTEPYVIGVLRHEHKIEPLMD